MDTLATYRTIIKEVIRKYAQLRPSHGQIRLDPVFDGIRWSAHDFILQPLRWHPVAVASNRQEQVIGHGLFFMGCGPLFDTRQDHEHDAACGD